MIKKIIISLSFLLIKQSVLADFMCDTNIPKYHAFYTINKYTCSSGEFLPADSLGCVSCPAGYTCSGGTYKYDADNFQGLDFDTNNISNTTINNICANNFPVGLHALYEHNQYNCPPGYYLPAGNDWLTDTQGCTICPLNNICVGGTYTFNETTDQGIESCNGSFAPTGSTVCYPHVLHIGNESIYLSATKRTTPSLNVAYGNEVFYANMTTTQTVMTAGSQHYFKTIYNDTEYYICDNTSCPQ